MSFYESPLLVNLTFNVRVFSYVWLTFLVKVFGHINLVKLTFIFVQRYFSIMRTPSKMILFHMLINKLISTQTC